MNAFIEQINSVGKMFVDFASPMLIQSSVLIIILLVLDTLLRKRIRAVFRYWIWMIVLIKLILPPSLSLPTSPSYWFGDKIEKITEYYPTTEETDTYHFSNFEFTRPSFDIEPTIYEPEPVLNSKEQIAAAPIIPKVSLSWWAIAFLTWIILSCIMFILLIQRTFFVKRLIGQSQEADEKLKNILEQARLQMRLKYKVELRLSKKALSPSVCGLLKPTILIPQKIAKRLNSYDLKAILLHELAHIKRYDLWVNLVQAVLQIIYIYNPLLWIANIIIRNVREQAVDEMVLVAMGEQAEEYPKTLLNISRFSFGSATLSLRLIGVAESKKALITRIKHITSRPFPKTVRIGITGLITIILAAVVLLPMAKVRRETKANNADLEAKYVDVREYLKGNITGYIEYSKIRKVIKKDDLSKLYQLLDDDEYAPYRIAVVNAIGYVSDDPESVNVLLKFIQRNDNKKHDTTWFMSRVGAFSMIGLIGGDTADSILRKGITKEGARELTKDWIDLPLTRNLGTERMIEWIQMGSLRGLLLSGNPENLALIEKMYNEQKEIAIKDHKITSLMLSLISTMAAKDYIAETNLETYMDLGGGQTRQRALLPYRNKYRLDLNEADSAETPESISQSAVELEIEVLKKALSDSAVDAKPVATSTSTGGVDIEALKKALFTMEPTLEFQQRLRITPLAEKSPQMQAIKQLEAAGSAEAINVLLECLTSNKIDSVLKQNALMALGRIGTKPAIEAITKFESWSRSRYGNPQPFYMGAMPSPVVHIIGAQAIPLAKTIDSENKTWALVPLSWYSQLDLFLTSQTSDDTWSEPILLDISGFPELHMSSKMQWTNKCELSVIEDVVKIEFINKNYEVKLGDQMKDTDKDGLPDSVEARLSTDPKNPDSDADGIPDGKDSNPLTPKHKEINDTTELRQAVFSLTFATSNSQSIVRVIDRGEFAKQEYYGYAGALIRVQKSIQGFVNLTSIDIRSQSEDSATVWINDYVGSLSARGQEVILKKINGKWVVIGFGRGIMA